MEFHPSGEHPHAECFDRIPWRSFSSLAPGTGWTLDSGNDTYQGSGGSNLTSNGSGTYTFPVSGGSVSGNMGQSSGDYSSYKFKITANVVSGAWVANGTRDEEFNSNSASNSTGSGSSTSAESIEANNTANVQRAWSHNSTEKSSTSGFANTSWLNGGWSLSGGSSNSSGNGSSHLSSNGTSNHSRTVDGGTLSGNLTVFSSNDSAWSSKSTANVANGVWVYSGNASDSANTTNNRTMNGTGHYTFNNATFSQNGTVTEFTFDSDSSDTSGASNQTPDGSWVQVGGNSTAITSGLQSLTYTDDVTIANQNITINNHTFSGTQSNSFIFGGRYKSTVQSDFVNGSWSTPNGTATVSDFIGLKLTISGHDTFTTQVNGNNIVEATTFNYQLSYNDYLNRNYSLASNGVWARGANTYTGELDTDFTNTFKKSNSPYSKTPAPTQVTGTGNITGNLSVSFTDKKTTHAELVFNKAGSDRSATSGTANLTVLHDYQSSYEGNGTYSRQLPDGSTFTGSMSESGKNDQWRSETVNFTLQQNSWTITDGTAGATVTIEDKFKSGGVSNHTEAVNTTDTSTIGVAIYYVGFDLGSPYGNSFNNYSDSAGHTTTVHQVTSTTTTAEEAFNHTTRLASTQNATLVKDANNTWSWSSLGNATSSNSGDWLIGNSSRFNGQATTTWSVNGVAYTATSKLDSNSAHRTTAKWEVTNNYSLSEGTWSNTKITDSLIIRDDQSFTASGTSNLATSGGPVSLTLNSDRKDDNEYHAWYNRNLTSSPATTPGTVTGNITWGYDSKAHFESGSNANLTVYSAYSSHNEYFIGNRSQTLTANSSWSQVNGGVPFGSSYGNLSAVRNYSGGTSDMWNGYGGFASTYCGTESQTWNDPSIASYDARNLTGTRFTPHDPPGVPAPYSFSTPSTSFVMPPALVEDPEAAANQTQSWAAWALDTGVSYVPVIGSLRDAYRAYMAGDKAGFILNVGMLGLDLWSLGGSSLAKGVAKSSLRAEKSLMKVGVKALASKGDDVAKIYNRCDNIGKNMFVNNADVAKGFADDVVGVGQKYKGCFAAGTPIQTPLGSKPIEEFVPGDWVLAQDESDPESSPTIRQVEEVFENQAQVMVLGLGDWSIETTPEHPFWVRDKGWMPAGEIEPGDELRSHDGQWIPLDSKHLTDSIITVYNMRVAEDHTYFVGSPLWGFSVWAHNTYPDPSDLSKLGAESGKGQLTKAGHSLSKHGAGKRPGNSAIPDPKGSPSQINQQAQKFLDDILNSPARVVKQRPGRPGQTLLQISRTDGVGVIYKWDGIGWQFSHFAENLF